MCVCVSVCVRVFRFVVCSRLLLDQHWAAAAADITFSTRSKTPRVSSNESTCYLSSFLFLLLLLLLSLLSSSFVLFLGQSFVVRRLLGDPLMCFVWVVALYHCVKRTKTPSTTTTRPLLYYLHTRHAQKEKVENDTLASNCVVVVVNRLFASSSRSLGYSSLLSPPTIQKSSISFSQTAAAAAVATVVSCLTQKKKKSWSSSSSFSIEFSFSWQ